MEYKVLDMTGKGSFVESGVGIHVQVHSSSATESRSALAASLNAAPVAAGQLKRVIIVVFIDAESSSSE
jgi:hypothetical protein